MLSLINLLHPCNEDPSPLFDMGIAVEAALFANLESDVGKEYRARVRSLVYNLKENETLRTSVLDGSLAPEELCALPPDELATAAQRAKREKMVGRCELHPGLKAPGFQTLMVKRMTSLST